MAEWTTNDLRTAALSNQKQVYVGAGAPGTAYDGQHWVDISTDPPILKVYDLTNTAWMTIMNVFYEELDADPWTDPVQDPVVNGTIVIVYNAHATFAAAPTRIWVYSNSAWAYVATAVTAGDWREAMIDAMISGQSDVTYAINDSIAGWNFFGDVTVNNAVELTVTGNVGGIVCRTLTNNGTITKSTSGTSGGNGYDAPEGNGGSGGGCLFIIAKTIDNNGIITADGEPGLAGVTHNADDGGGNQNTVTNLLRYSTHTRGGGGDGGGSVGGTAGTGGGGGGGGPQIGETGGDTGNVTYHTFASAAGLDGAVLGMAYGQSTYEYDGGGGGGGAATNGLGCGGGGGGGGGSMYISVGTYDNTGGTISANGGKGGNGGAEGASDPGGGGGGGGLIYILYEVQIAAGTVTASGGARGTGNNNGTAGSAGTATAVDVF